MSYCLVADLTTRFGEEELISITDRSGSGVIDEVTAQLALDDATKLIDGYLPHGTDTALNADVLSRACANIARYYLYDDAPTSTVELRYKNEINWLKDVAKGVVQLDVALDDVDTAEPDTLVIFSADEKVFSGDVDVDEI